MKLEEIQKLFVKEAIKVDPRGNEAVEFDLLKRKEKFESLSKERQEYFDKESLQNPYYDSRVLYGEPKTEVKTVMVGIDIETSEVLLAKQLIATGKKIDLIIAHHPEGFAYSTFANVVGMQSDILNKQGISINISEKLISKRIEEVRNSILPQNNERVFDVARLLNIPLMTAHSVADNHVANFLQEKFNSCKPLRLKNIIEFLNTQPEYQHASKIGHAPMILIGNDDDRCGKIFVDMTGGTEGPIEEIEKLANAGVGTLVCMHLSSKAVKEAQKNNLNVVLAGHISSDNLGLNLLFDKLEKQLGILDFVECSGFRRFRRK